MSVKLQEIMGAAHARSASLAAEVVGYLVLAAADQLAGAPRRLGFGDIVLSEEGQVRVGGGTPAGEREAEQSLRDVLGLMLQLASSVTPGLLRAAQKPAGVGVDALVREIEVALVPVNRAAARRALSRLHRDVTRAREAGRLVAWEPRAVPGPSQPGAVEVGAPSSVEPPPAVRGPSQAATVEVGAPPSVEPPPAAPEPGGGDVAALLSRDSHPPVTSGGERGWLTPDSVAVADVEWPAQDRARADDELLTVIPVYVEQPSPSPAVALPVVPDLEVPPSEPRAALVPEPPEPVTVPQPLVAPAVLPVAPADARVGQTPVLGSTVAVLEAAPVEISQPTPGVLVLQGDEATERMPSVMELEPLAVEARADDALETLDPPPAARRRSAQPAAVRAALVETLGPPSAAPAASAEPAAVRAALVESLDPPSAAPAGDPGSSLPPPEGAAGDATPSAGSRARVDAPAAAASGELEPAPLAERLDVQSPSPAPRVSPRETLERLAALPARPPRHEYAPPRYAPRRSDVEELLAGFGVAEARNEHELCSDLKALAGVDRTAPPPPVELSETPPPVAVVEGEEAAARPSAAVGRAANARLVAGAATAALLATGVGLASVSARDSGTTQVALGAPVAPAAEPSVAPCSAELTVRQIPPRARTRLRTGDGGVVVPSRVVGTDAVFEGLPCRQSAEVSVELPGRARWVRIPVGADALSPSAEAPGLVRYTVALR